MKRYNKKFIAWTLIFVLIFPSYVYGAETITVPYEVRGEEQQDAELKQQLGEAPVSVQAAGEGNPVIDKVLSGAGESDETESYEVKNLGAEQYMQGGGLDRTQPTEAEILAKWKEVTVPDNVFETEPSIVNPYAAGKLDETFINSNLSYLNFIRYISGLNPVQDTDALNESAQHGAVLLAALGSYLDHNPPKPSDMPDDFYNKGYAATSSSNLYYQMSHSYYIPQLPKAQIQGYMDDNIGASNLSVVGHRRWLLNPTLLNVGFGFAYDEYEELGNGYIQSYMATKVFDTSGEALDYNFISWPVSGNMPNKLIGTSVPWSVTVNPSKYQTSSLKNATVTITRSSDNKSWTLNSSTGSTPSNEESYFLVDLGGYGVANCIIFHIGSNNFGTSILEGDYVVSISGIKDIKGNTATITYKTHFYQMEEVLATSVVIKADRSYLPVGGTCQLTATVHPENATSKKVIWSSENPDVATVDQNGLVTCVTDKAGEIVFIDADTVDGSGKFGGFYLVTGMPVTGVSLDKETVTLELDQAAGVQLTATILPEGAADKSVKWTSSNPEIATVSENGVVKPVKSGTAVITVETVDQGKKAVCTVTVLPDKTPVKDFVRRLYSLVLLRDADEGGLNSWTDALLDHSSNGVDAGYGFVFSQECIGRELSDSDFVDMLYKTFMNRESDEGGKRAWVSQLEVGVEREKILEGFIMSQEFAGICEEYGISVGSVADVEAFNEALNHYCNQNADVTAFVARCYTQALGRSFDSVGLESWCRVIIEQENTPTDVAKNFIFSEEFIGKNLSDEDYVRVLYRTFMGREADGAGLSGWVAVLQSGEEDREKVLEGFANSDEFAEILTSFGLN